MRSGKPGTIVIMQPSYLPWVGYFSLVDQASVFVFLDTVQFEKQSWQQRNRIRTPKGLEWITVPVFIKGRFGQLIREVEINPERFPDKHMKQIRQNYSRAPYFKTYEEEFFDVLRRASQRFSLSDLNIALIEWISAKLTLSARFIRSSQLRAMGKRTELLVQILRELGASDYLSPLGSLEYIRTEYSLFVENEIDVTFQNYVHPEYRQTYTPFVPYASVIDVLFNEGERSIDVIRSGDMAPLQAKELIK